MIAVFILLLCGGLMYWLLKPDSIPLAEGRETPQLTWNPSEPMPRNSGILYGEIK